MRPWPSSKVANSIGSSFAVETGFDVVSIPAQSTVRPTCSEQRGGVDDSEPRQAVAEEVHRVAVSGEAEQLVLARRVSRA